MKVCANLSGKHSSPDKTEKQILPQSLDETESRADGAAGEAGQSVCEDRLESSLFLILSFIVCLCIMGTLISIGGVLYLKYRSRTQVATLEKRNLIGIIHNPPPFESKKHLKSGNSDSFASSSTNSFLSSSDISLGNESNVITGRDSADKLTGDQSDGQANLNSIPFKITTSITRLLNISSIPAFGSLKNQWSLEQAPSARQVLQAVKQFFQFFRSSNYDVDRMR